MDFHLTDIFWGVDYFCNLWCRCTTFCLASGEGEESVKVKLMEGNLKYGGNQIFPRTGLERGK